MSCSEKRRKKLLISSIEMAKTIQLSRLHEVLDLGVGKRIQRDPLRAYRKRLGFNISCISGSGLKNLDMNTTVSSYAYRKNHQLK